MSIHSLYNSPLGRLTVVALQKAGVFRLTSWFLHTSISRKIVPGYIKKHQIDMQDFEDRKYMSFADFFSRKKSLPPCISNSGMLISPCDGLMSIHRITENMNIAMKGSCYRLADLVPDAELAGRFADGICLVFRLQASDYHHFCVFDDAMLSETHFVAGELHSVQPIAYEKIPVYRLNRRWWSVLDTAHFGTAVQVEVGAMLVGGVRFVKEAGWLCQGDEMGNFELSGSTILLILSADVRTRFEFNAKFQKSISEPIEIPVSMGEGIGALKTTAVPTVPK